MTLKYPKTAMGWSGAGGRRAERAHERGDGRERARCSDIVA